jgi:hypothetical protein
MQSDSPDQPPALAHDSLEPALARTLVALLGRLIPGDELGPGAAEAGVLDFVDSELRGALYSRRGLYADGLRRLDDLARERAGDEFAALPAERQDELLHEVEALDPRGEDGALRAFFEQALGDCIDGFLSDPVYGGNAGGAGWKLIGYPGPSLTWTKEEQELDVVVPWRDSTVANLRRRERLLRGESAADGGDGA